MFTDLQYRILKKISPQTPGGGAGTEPFYEGKSKLAVLLGDGIFGQLAGKVTIDFGCGGGADTVEMAARGASRVIGLDIREDVLEAGRENARKAGVADRCTFMSSVSSTGDLADVVISVDAFEHFEDPGAILQIMSGLLRPGGEVMVSFGPTWYHPLGGHLFSVFPWAHLLFSEEALIRWRSDFKTDGATRFSECAGGLNRMTIARFEALVARSPLKFASLELVPIRPLRKVHNRLTREFTTAIVRCRLVKRA